jgi:hypothetical protein
MSFRRDTQGQSTVQHLWTRRQFESVRKPCHANHNAVGQGDNGGQSPLYKTTFFIFIFYFIFVYIYTSPHPRIHSSTHLCQPNAHCEHAPAPAATNGRSNISEALIVNTRKVSHNANIVNMAAKTRQGNDDHSNHRNHRNHFLFLVLIDSISCFHFHFHFRTSEN